MQLPLQLILLYYSHHLTSYNIIILCNFICIKYFNKFYIHHFSETAHSVQSWYIIIYNYFNEAESQFSFEIASVNIQLFIYNNNISITMSILNIFLCNHLKICTNKIIFHDFYFHFLHVSILISHIFFLSGIVLRASPKPTI